MLSKINTYTSGILGMFMICCSYNLGLAHTIPVSEIYIVPDRAEVHLELTINSFELSFLSEIDENHNGFIDESEMESYRSKIKKRLLSVISVQMDDKTVEAEAAGLILNSRNHHLTLRAHYPKEWEYETLKLTSNIEQITSKSQITQVTYGNAPHTQKARLESDTNVATFGKRQNNHKGLWASIFGMQSIVLLIWVLLLGAGGFYGVQKLRLTGIKDTEI